MTDKRESFGNMVAAFGSNWNKVEKTANKKQQILDQLKKQGDM